MNVAYPIVMDRQHAIWRALDNQAWLALYFVDARGHIRHHYYGEGAYDQAEEIIQQLLAEAGHPGGSQELVSIDPKGVEAQADWRSLRTAETYVGYGRAENFASPGGPVEDRPADYAAPAKLGPTGGSCSAFTRATCISSWDRRRLAHPRGFAS